MGMQLVSAWCADEKASQTHDPADLPPFPVIHPGVTRDRTDLLCSACFVSMDLQCTTDLPCHVSAPKIVASEIATSGGQAIPLLESHQAAPVTPQIIVTALLGVDRAP
jgi:hypothetical protein